MIMNGQENNMNLPKEPLADNMTNLISQLANEVYREDLAPELMEQFTAAKVSAVEKPLRSASHQEVIANLPKSPVSTHQPAYTENIHKHMDPLKFEHPGIDIGSHTDGYYFLKEYKSVPVSKQSEAYYYRPGLDVHGIRKDFPILHRRINGRPLIWLDNSATTQKPMCVIDALNRFYSEYNSNIHRGAHTLAKLATNAYEDAREKVKNFIGASSAEEIIFVRGTTEAINLVAESFGGMNIQAGDEIILTTMEHHANIVPWQKIAQEKGAVIKVIPINDRGEVILDEYEKLLSRRTRMVSITHVSNVLGTVNPVGKMIEMAHVHGAKVLIDGAQSAPHTAIHVRNMDADFFAFSGHKIYGPTGIGVLYGKKAILEEMPPWQRGGGMIKDVSFTETTYNTLPYKFEAGTGNIADAVGLGAAIDYVQKVGMGNIERHEKELTGYAMEKLYQIPGLHLIGTSPDKTSVLSFVIDGVVPDQAAQYLNLEGIAVRSGHHCAQPSLRRFGLNSSIRASLGIYNIREEVDSLVNAVLKIAKHYH